MAVGGEPGLARDLPDGIGDDLGGERRMGREDPLGVEGVEAVEAEDGVEVDQPAPLELSDLGVGQLDPGAVGLGELVQLAAEPDDGPSPQLGCVGVPPPKWMRARRRRAPCTTRS